MSSPRLVGTPPIAFAPGRFAHPTQVDWVRFRSIGKSSFSESYGKFRPTNGIAVPLSPDDETAKMDDTRCG
jgi:hypothetical protein